MAQFDLGQATLRIRGSHLQLHLAATVQLHQPQSDDRPSLQRFVSQVSDLDGIWITEAPETKLCFFIRCDWKLKDEVSTLVTELRQKLCGLKVWSELGFSASLLDEGVEQFASSGTHRLSLSLRKEHSIPTDKKQWALPVAIANPPEACPPGNAPATTLASVEISMEYCFHEEQDFQVSDFSYHEPLFPQRELSSFEFELELEAIAESQLAHEFVWLEGMDREAFSQRIEPRDNCTNTGNLENFSDNVLQLFEFGFQKLIISKSARSPKIWVSSDASLSSLPDIAPHIFKSGCREATNQRGVIIPTITKALSDILQGSDPPLREKLIDHIQYVQSSEKGSSQTDSQAPGLRNIIHSRLWDIALAATRNSKPLKKKQLMLSAATFDREPHITGKEIHSMPMGPHLDKIISEKSADYRLQQCAEDEDKFASLMIEPDCSSECEGQLLDNYSETSFTDLGESTQTSLDSLLSTAASSQMTLSDNEIMLFSDSNDGASDGEDTAKHLYNVGEMNAWDADLMLMDRP